MAETPVIQLQGFGFFDACQWEPQPDTSAWIIEYVLPKNAFGFVAGPAKGNASPHGGKSVMERLMALCIIEGKDFFGHKVLETGRVMFVNLDEDAEKQVRLYYRMTKGRKVPGYLISNAKSCRLPEQIKILEEDIKQAKPLVVIIDPLQRTLGGKKVKEQSDVGPVIDELKRISKEYNCTIIVNHHSNKDQERDKESTASWLSGSNDLDAAWDFCLCLEYEKKSEAMHLRNFQKEKAKTDIFYEAEIINKDEIVGLYAVPEELGENRKARTLLKAIHQHPEKSLQAICKISDVSERSAYNYRKQFAIVEKALANISFSIDKNDCKTISLEGGGLQVQ